MQKHRIILAKLSLVDDPRRRQRREHPLGIILFIAICTMLAGGESFYAMEAFAEANRDWLEKHVGMESVPSHDTFNRVFQLLSDRSLNNLFIESMAEFRSIRKGDIIAMDGKALRGTGKSVGTMLQVLNVWSVANGIALGQVPISSKTNEIPAVQEILEYIDVTDCVVTTDAINCQKKTVEKIIEKSGDYMLALKGNQKRLFEEAKLFMEDYAARHEPDFCKHDKGHGRIEMRKLWQTAEVSWYQDIGDWPGLRSFCLLEATRDFGDRSETDRRLFISSLPYDPERAADAIRSHWQVENGLHWILDVTFGKINAGPERRMRPKILPL